MKFYCVYILKSDKDENLYTGYTSDLKKRLSQHINGEGTSTKFRRPINLIYFEACLNKYDAIHKEKYLKTTYGKRYIKNRLKNHLNDSN